MECDSIPPHLIGRIPIVGPLQRPGLGGDESDRDRHSSRSPSPASPSSRLRSPLHGAPASRPEVPGSITTTPSSSSSSSSTSSTGMVQHHNHRPGSPAHHHQRPSSEHEDREEELVVCDEDDLHQADLSKQRKCSEDNTSDSKCNNNNNNNNEKKGTERSLMAGREHTHPHHGVLRDTKDFIRSRSPLARSRSPSGERESSGGSIIRPTVLSSSIGSSSDKKDNAPTSGSELAVTPKPRIWSLADVATSSNSYSSQRRQSPPPPGLSLHLGGHPHKHPSPHHMGSAGPYPAHLNGFRLPWVSVSGAFINGHHGGPHPGGLPHPYVLSPHAMLPRGIPPGVMAPTPTHGPPPPPPHPPHGAGGEAAAAGRPHPYSRPGGLPHPRSHLQAPPPPPPPPPPPSLPHPPPPPPPGPPPPPPPPPSSQTPARSSPEAHRSNGTMHPRSSPIERHTGELMIDYTRPINCFTSQFYPVFPC